MLTLTGANVDQRLQRMSYIVGDRTVAVCKLGIINLILHLFQIDNESSNPDGLEQLMYVMNKMLLHMMCAATRYFTVTPQVPSNAHASRYETSQRQAVLLLPPDMIGRPSTPMCALPTLGLAAAPRSSNGMFVKLGLAQR